MKKLFRISDIVMFCYLCLTLFLLFPVLGFAGMYLIDILGLSLYRPELYMLWMIPCSCLFMYGVWLVDKWGRRNDDKELKLIEQKKSPSFEKDINHSTDFIFTTKSVKDLEVYK